MANPNFFYQEDDYLNNGQSLASVADSQHRLGVANGSIFDPPAGNQSGIDLEDASMNRLYMSRPDLAVRHYLEGQGMWGRGAGTPFAQYMSGVFGESLPTLYQFSKGIGEGQGLEDFGGFVGDMTNQFLSGGSAAFHDQLGQRLVGMIRGDITDNAYAQRLGLVKSDPGSQFSLIRDFINATAAATMTAFEQETANAMLDQLFSQYTAEWGGRTDAVSFGEFLIGQGADAVNYLQDYFGFDF